MKGMNGKGGNMKGGLCPPAVAPGDAVDVVAAEAVEVGAVDCPVVVVVVGVAPLCGCCWACGGGLKGNGGTPPAIRFIKFGTAGFC